MRPLVKSAYQKNKFLFSNPQVFYLAILRPYMGVIPNLKMVFIFPISCILALIFPIVIKKFPKCEGKGSFLKFQIKSLNQTICCGYSKEPSQ